jgi:hypothetical protein
MNDVFGDAELVAAHAVFRGFSGSAAIGVPGTSRKLVGPRLCQRTRFNSEINSSMIESLISADRGGRPASIVSVKGSICRENTFDEFRG